MADQERTIQVQMGDVRRLVHVVYKTRFIRDEMIVAVDGKTVVKSPVTLDENLLYAKKSVNFSLIDDTGPHVTTLQISMARMSNKITACKLTVGGQMLYED